MNVGEFRKLLESLAVWHDETGRSAEAAALREVLTLFEEGSHQKLSPALKAMAARLGR